MNGIHPARPNFLLLTVECWRADHFGAGTPYLAHLGDEAVVFTEAQASGGWTLPSMTGLMSSSYPSMHGGCRLSLRTPERKPLAEYLLDEGYWTAGFTANPTCGSRNGFHRGFGDFSDVARKAPALSEEAYRYREDGQSLGLMGIAPSAVEKIADAAQVTDTALRWVEAREPGQPWFLWIHYTDSHWPYLKPDSGLSRDELLDLWRDRRLFNKEIYPSRGQYAAPEEARIRWHNRYREALTNTDREIGRLFDFARTRTDWGRTIVIAAGDHGEEFFEHGSWQHQWNRLYREGVHVPLIARVPGAAPRRVDQPVAHVDIAPTLLGYAGIEPSRPMVGNTLEPLIDGHTREPKPVLTEMLAFPNGSSYLLAIRDGNWKYIYDFDDRMNSKLFQVAEDPGERENVRERHPHVFRRFEQMRLEHVSRGLIRLLERRSPAEQYEQDDAVAQEQLAALGYL